MALAPEIIEGESGPEMFWSLEDFHLAVPVKALDAVVAQIGGATALLTLDRCLKSLHLDQEEFL